MSFGILLLVVCFIAGVVPQPVSVVIDTRALVEKTSDVFAPAFGWEMYAMMGYLPAMNDTRFVKAASALAPAVVRVGGISADWVRYVLDEEEEEARISSSPPSSHFERGVGNTPFWPNSDQNLTLTDFMTLYNFFQASGLRLMFDLNELYGRNCTGTSPTGQPDCWCSGAWDMSNVQAFLQYIHDHGLYTSGKGPLIGFELGNELVSHMYASTNVQDIFALSDMIKTVWSDVPSSQVPPFYAPSTDACWDLNTSYIMNATEKVITGFTFHAYPGGSGVGEFNLSSILVNVTWLRYGILRGQNPAQQCIGWWNAGPRQSGVELWITESSSSYAWNLPPPAQNSFIHGFFTLAELGQHATTGVSAVCRWSFAEQSPFGTIMLNGSRWDVASDYFVLVLYKQLVGSGVFNASLNYDAPILAYAQCAAGLNGGLVVFAINPSLEEITLNLLTASSAPLNVVPRIEYVLTPPGGNLSSTTPVLNGNEGSPLRINDDGSLPEMEGHSVTQAGSAVTMPPLSQAFFVFPSAGLAPCSL